MLVNPKVDDFSFLLTEDFDPEPPLVNRTADSFTSNARVLTAEELSRGTRPSGSHFSSATDIHYVNGSRLRLLDQQIGWWERIEEEFKQEAIRQQIEQDTRDGTIRGLERSKAALSDQLAESRAEVTSLQEEVAFLREERAFSNGKPNNEDLNRFMKKLHASAMSASREDATYGGLRWPDI
ncbi:hypothetical protein L204_105146 [Cryptococcus depauperatus]|nr:hypothetical protein L204_03797 [Cryptococcus depauperatus CBS 7855]